MFTTLTQTHLCRSVLLLFLLFTPMFSSSGASCKDSESGEGLVSSTVGPMSRPPICFYRCEKCRPCKAVLVTTPPAAHQQTASGSGGPNDYYPQAWRCTCDGKLYDP
ncbi:hypothetical protein ACSQ67_022626 [Phaseolus vulgaris]